MKLSSELISQFAKITNDKPERPKESYVYGTAYNTDKVNGIMGTYVKIDGSSNVTTWLTPVATTTDVNGTDVTNGDRVIVRIKDHKATITGNLSSPSANNTSTMHLLSGMASADDLNDLTTRVETLEANKLDIVEAENKYATIEWVNEMLANINTQSTDFVKTTYTVSPIESTGKLMDNVTESIYTTSPIQNAGRIMENVSEVSYTINNIDDYMNSAITQLDSRGIVGWFTPENLDIQNGIWNNSISGGTSITLNGGIKHDDTTLYLNNDEYGEFQHSVEPNTLYVICKLSNQVDNWTPILTKNIVTPDGETINDNYWGFDLFYSPNSYCCACSIANDIVSSISGTDTFHVLACSRENGVMYFYIDGKPISGKGDVQTGKYGGKYYVNRCIRSGGDDCTPAPVYYKTILIGTEYHDTDTVINNSKYLKKLYSI